MTSPSTSTLVLHDSRTGRKLTFVPLDPQRITIYVCGPTVYNFVHIGNGRPAVVFDVLVRLLRHLYPHVVYARNITDVDDKINARAADEKISIRELTEKALWQIWGRSGDAAAGDPVRRADQRPRSADDKRGARGARRSG